MFIVSDVRHRFMFWTSVELRAEVDMTLTKKHLRLGKVGAPVLDTRELEVQAGEAFLINAKRSDGYKVGDQVPLDRVANKLPISLKWNTVKTA